MYSQNLRNSSGVQNNNNASNLAHKLPLKFKAMILKSIYQKHRQRQLICLQRTFFKWYIQKNDDKILKDSIDKILIAQKEEKFTSVRFFYRMKIYIRNQRHDSQIDPNSNICQAKNEESQILQNPSHIRKNIYVDNLSEYFQSLKNIFSMRFLQGQNKTSLNKIENQFQDESISNLKYKKLRFKTQGNQRNQVSEISIPSRAQINFKQEYCQKEAQKQSIQQKTKKFGVKVSLTLMSTCLLTISKRHYLQVFYKIFQSSRSNKVRQQNEQDNFKCLKQLQRIAISGQPNSQSPDPLVYCQNSNLLPNDTESLHCVSESQISSCFIIPASTYIDQQIGQVQYSIQLLSSTIQKDSQILSLYTQFQKQYRQFQVIQKDFSQLRIKTKNSVFERTTNIFAKLGIHLKKQSFEKIRMFVQQKQVKEQKQKSMQQVITKNLTKSRANTQTLDHTCCKPLTLPIQQNVQNQEINVEAQQIKSMTSIKVIKERIEISQSQSDRQSVKSGIRRQNVRSGLMTQFNAQKKVQSSYGKGFYNEKVNSLNKTPSQSLNHVKIQANSKVVSQSCKSGSNNIIKSQKCSQMSISIKQQDCFKKIKNDEYKNSQQQTCIYLRNNVYDLSYKTLKSQQSSQTKRYHAQIKSQYWWNDGIDHKQSLVCNNQSNFQNNKFNRTDKTYKTYNSVSQSNSSIQSSKIDKQNIYKKHLH